MLIHLMFYTMCACYPTWCCGQLQYWDYESINLLLKPISTLGGKRKSEQNWQLHFNMKLNKFKEEFGKLHSLIYLKICKEI